MTRRAAFPALLLVTLATLGCDVLQAPDLPIPCEQEFSDAHCLAIVDTVGVKLDLTRADIVAVAILPSESKGMTLGGAAPVSVRVTLVDGSTQDVPIGCGGLAMAPACSDDPHLEPASIILGGYHDVPCAGEPPAGCATPVRRRTRQASQPQPNCSSTASTSPSTTSATTTCRSARPAYRTVC